eukprot:TRINITY_DN5575_c0_g1_i2.p1 TRINITY_DN5575_c0_g1~~TRINITY_DN5575_c0_g1_i2.p1  ORF type:complete len:438 (-),score=49.09 TRINITY_DN5575_c0_g1_i2:338-1651(-)
MPTEEGLVMAGARVMVRAAGRKDNDVHRSASSRLAVFSLLYILVGLLSILYCHLFIGCYGICTPLGCACQRDRGGRDCSLSVYTEHDLHLPLASSLSSVATTSSCRETGCSEHGRCDEVDDAKATPGACLCEENFVGIDCSVEICRASRTTSSCGKPEMIIIGTQKGGTSSMYYYLVRHPDILPSRTKEIHFFDQHYHEGLDWYFQRFKKRRNDREIRLESTPRYLLDWDTPPRLYSILPRVKLIVLLRDPTSRAQSAYLMNKHRKSRGAKGSFAVEINSCLAKLSRLCNNLETYADYERCSLSGVISSTKLVSRGVYAYQLKRWFQFFGGNADNTIAGRDVGVSIPSQFLVIKSSSFFADPSTTLQRVLAFMGRAEDDYFPNKPKMFMHVHNQNPVGLRMDSPTIEAIRRLREFYRPHNERLQQMVGFGKEWDDAT